MKKAGITIFSLIMILVIILLTVRGCSLNKKTVETPKRGEGVNIELQNNSSHSGNTSEKEGVSVNNPNTTKDVTDKDTISGENKKGNLVNSDLGNTGEKDNFIEVENTSLSDSISVDALVSSKKTYLVNSEYYAYRVGLLLPHNEGYTIVNYYCPRKTFEAVDVGSSVKVEYQTDNEGAISIVSLSK